MTRHGGLMTSSQAPASPASLLLVRHQERFVSGRRGDSEGLVGGAAVRTPRRLTLAVLATRRLVLAARAADLTLALTGTARRAVRPALRGGGGGGPAARV